MAGNKLMTAGYLLLGAGFIAQGISMLRGARALFPPDGSTNGLGESLPAALRRTKGQIQKKTVMRAGSIENRAAMIRRLIRKDSENPEIRNQALAVLTRKCGVDGNRRWCVPVKNWDAEVKAMFKAVTDPNSPISTRYVRDHLEKDTFVAANKTMKLRGGDCDDMTIYLGSLLMSVGYPVKLRIVQAKGAPTWSHIYLLVGLPPTDPARWVPLDATVNKPAGWEAPDYMIVRRKDFEV